MQDWRRFFEHADFVIDGEYTTGAQKQLYGRTGTALPSAPWRYCEGYP